MSVMEPHSDKLQYIFDNARVGIAICNAKDNTLEMVNPAFAAIHGYEPHELIGVSPGEVFAPECMLRLQAHENVPSCAINDVSFETTHIRKDGSLVPVSVHITVIKDENGIIKQRIANIQDISDQKKTKSELQITHERFAQIYDNSIDIIYLIEVTPEGRFIHLDINPAYVRASGMSREAIVGCYVDEFENETYRTILLEKYGSCLTAGKKTDYTNDYPLPSGVRTLHSVLTPLFDEKGRIHQIVGIARDITEQKRMESALEAREREFRSLAKNHPDNIARWDTDGRYLYINPVHERTLGKSAAQVIGTFLSDEHAAVKAAITQVAITGEQITVSQTVPAQDESLEYHEVAITPERDLSGKIVSILGIGRNVTERKRQEEVVREREAFLDSLLKAIPIPVFYKNTDGIYLGVNKAYETFFGTTPEQFVGKSVFDIHPKELAEIYHAKDTEVFESKAEIQQYETQLKHTNGMLHDIIFSKAAFFDNQGDVKGLIGAVLDITERKRSEEALKSQSILLQSVLESSPNVTIFALDREYNYSAFNQNHGKVIHEIWGHEIDIGMNMLDSITREDDKQKAKALFDKALAGECFVDETEYGDETLSRSYWQTYYAPMIDNNGEIIGLTCFNLNITDKRKQELQLHKTKAKLSAVISTIPDLIWVKDAEGVYMMCNPAFENFFGAKCGEIVGKTDYDFISRSQADFFRQKDLEAMEAGEMRINEEEIIFAHNGQRALLETRKIPVYNGKEFMGVLGIGHDITERKKMESKIATQKEFQNTLLVGIAEAGLGVHVIEEGKYIYTNDLKKAKKYGYDETSFDTKPNFLETIHPDDRSKALNMYARRLRGEDVPNTYELGVVQTDGVRREHSVSVIVIPNTDPIQTIVVTQDITERKVMEERIIQNESRLKEAQKIAKVGSWELEFPGFELTWSDEIYRIFEIDPKQFQPSYDSFLNAIHPDDRDYLDTVFNDSLNNKTPYDIVHRLSMSDGRIKYVHERGETIYDKEGNLIRSVGTVQDITKQKVIEKKIDHMAHHDALTGLPNRTLAKIRAEQIMDQAKCSDSKAAFLFIDLDGFKAINDTLGHSVGDLILKSVASRLKACIRESDTISRQGGDEFLLVLSGVQENGVIASIAKKILAALEKSFEINSHTLCLSGSIGIALYPDHGETFELLLQNADTAMYKAKETGKNGYHFYTQQMTHNMIGQFKIQNDLKNGLENDEFILFYQPQIDLATNRITGVEALIRWCHPQLGMMPPMSFIPIAESSGLIVPIGQWVIEEACRQAALWQKMGIDLCVAVNISAMQFKRGNLEEIVKNALHTSKINPNRLELELTESIMMHDADNTLQSVRNLKELGVQLSIDDFGTGYSSLAYLKRFAVDKLKIDQSFVRDILQDREDATIVKTIIQMAKNLNLKTIAEGVENAQVLSVIDAYGCDEVQGYHFAKPMGASEFEYYHTNFYNSES